MPTPGHSWHHCSGSPCASSATTSSHSRHCSAPALKMQQPSPLPHRDSGAGLSAALTPQTRNGRTLGHIMSLLGTEHVAQTWPSVWPHVLQLHQCVLVHQSGSSWKCFVLQQIWSGRCNMPPAPIPEATRACVLAHSFGWWVLRSGPADRMISSTVSVTTKKQCQQPCVTGWG